MAVVAGLRMRFRVRRCFEYDCRLSLQIGLIIVRDGILCDSVGNFLGDY